MESVCGDHFEFLPTVNVSYNTFSKKKYSHAVRVMSCVVYDVKAHHSVVLISRKKKNLNISEWTCFS